MSYDLFMPIEEMKAVGKWPIPWTSAMGLVPEIKKLGDDIVGCEIGTNLGINVVYFLDHLPNIKTLYAVDPYSPYDDRITGGEFVTQELQDRIKSTFLNNIEKYKERIVFIHKTSDDALNDIPDHSLDYIFIDGDHNYDAVIKDFRNYYNKVKIGGIFAGHDAFSHGVQKALSIFVPEMNVDPQKIRVCDHQTFYWIR
jgi:predicted O-methyltransferase YrrM